MSTRKRKRKQKRRAEYLASGLEVHGAFATKAAADRKARQRGGFVVKKFARWGGGSLSTRYCVFTKSETPF